MAMLLRERGHPGPRSPTASCPATATRGRHRASRRAAPTPGSRSTSRASAGSSSTRPAARSPARVPLPSGAARDAARRRPARPVPSLPRPATRRAVAATRRPSPPGRHRVRRRPASGRSSSIARDPARRRSARWPSSPGSAVRRRGRAPDQAWRRVARPGRRFGFGPRPVADRLRVRRRPRRRAAAAAPELTTIARAKVEVAYGRRDLGDDRLRALREAPSPAPARAPRLVFRRRRAAPPGGRLGRAA